MSKQSDEQYHEAVRGVLDDLAGLVAERLHEGAEPLVDTNAVVPWQSADGKTHHIEIRLSVAPTNMGKLMSATRGAGR